MKCCSKQWLPDFLIALEIVALVFLFKSALEGKKLRLTIQITTLNNCGDQQEKCDSGLCLCLVGGGLQSVSSKPQRKESSWLRKKTSSVSA